MSNAAFFDSLFGRLASECGWTPDEVSAMAYADVMRQFRYFKSRPPAGDLMTIIASFCGWQPDAARETRKMDMGPGYVPAAARRRAKPAAT